MLEPDRDRDRFPASGGDEGARGSKVGGLKEGVGTPNSNVQSQLAQSGLVLARLGTKVAVN